MDYGWIFLIGIWFSKSLLPMPCWSSLERHWLCAWLVLSGWDCRRFHSGELAVTMLCSVCLSSASARRDKARHCLFRGCQEALSRPHLVAWRLVSIRGIRTPIEGRCCDIWRITSVFFKPMPYKKILNDEVVAASLFQPPPRSYLSYTHLSTLGLFPSMCPHVAVFSLCSPLSS